MKVLHGAVFGALLLTAPAMALAGNGSGGGGMAGVVSRPATAAIPTPAANQSRFTVARAGTVVYTDASGGTDPVTRAAPAQPSSNIVPTHSAAWLANQMGGGR